MASPAPSESSLESGQWNDEDQSFYFDTHPTPYESFDPDQSFEGYQHLFMKPQFNDDVKLGTSSSLEPLGSHSNVKHEEQALPFRQQRLERCCFNCGETGHAVAQCSQPRDRERIRQRRLEFESEKLQRGEGDDEGFGEINGHARLHEQFASTEQRIRWLDEFVPGKPSRALIDALLPETDDQGSLRDLPYLQRMLVWGYPPGWISSKDPVEQIRRGIQSDSQWDYVEVLAGFDVAALDKSAHHPQSRPGDTRASAAKEKRDLSTDENAKRRQATVETVARF
ncbi:hypothetical protein EX895_004365 [Sporisorium graminicola]|uniref:CCHC-type domain-containing protein n=1 Tax=Sporisorium graminicola TaxID=280036 RepID=A0A4U7KQF5_9BASI|nr:hypothetical protein EX895_004365 [Sporisorium graminicola]TKY86725.1 hypothetical protein EX895_004365 [Sporisorium graminicola]